MEQYSHPWTNSRTRWLTLLTRKSLHPNLQSRKLPLPLAEPSMPSPGRSSTKLSKHSAIAEQKRSSNFPKSRSLEIKAPEKVLSSKLSPKSKCLELPAPAPDVRWRLFSPALLSTMIGIVKSL